MWTKLHVPYVPLSIGFMIHMLIRFICAGVFASSITYSRTIPKSLSVRKLLSYNIVSDSISYCVPIMVFHSDFWDLCRFQWRISAESLFNAAKSINYLSSSTTTLLFFFFLSERGARQKTDGWVTNIGSQSIPIRIHRLIRVYRAHTSQPNVRRVVTNSDKSNA